MSDGDETVTGGASADGVDPPSAGSIDLSGRQPDEFDDYFEIARNPGQLVNIDRLFTRETFEGLVLIFAGLLVLIWPDEGPAVTAKIIGAVLITVAVIDISRELRRHGLRRMAGPLAFGRLAWLGVGIVLVAWPDATASVILNLVVLVIAIDGIRSLAGMLSGWRLAEDWTWPLASGLFKLTLAAALWVAGDTMFDLAVAIAAGVAILAGAITVVTNLRADTEDEITIRDTGGIMLVWLDGRAQTADDRQVLYQKLFYEGDTAGRRLSRFFVLMFFAATIASFGVIQDSTAVVIGAMLIAPLMTPLMGTAASVIMGWPRRASRSAATAFFGALLAVGIGLIVAFAFPIGLSLEANTQITSRVSPTLIDMAIALAAGAAGAFALSRPDVSDALPGVAVAIALVPPLTVIGITLADGAFADAFGATVLFTTNAVAILLAGALVFLLTGFTPLRRVIERRDWISRTLTTVGVLFLAVFIVLAVTADEISQGSFQLRTVRVTTEEWLGDPTTLSIREVSVTGSDVEIVIIGPVPPPSAEELAADLEEALERDIDLKVIYLPTSEFIVESDAAAAP